MELNRCRQYHASARLINTARNAFEYILLARGYKRVYIPYYTCDVLLQPIKRVGVDYKFYYLDSLLEPRCCPELREGEAFLYTNYFGLKQGCVERLAVLYGNKLIVDNAQAFYSKPVKGIDTFYSARKFFGVPDGAFLFTEKDLGDEMERDKSYVRCSHLLRRVDEGAESAYPDFKESETRLNNQPVRRMSYLTEAMLAGIDYGKTLERRIANYKFLDASLRSTNDIHLSLEDGDVPMVYPFYSNDSTLRSRLIEQKIFVATYWPNVLEWCNENDLEYNLAKNLIPLPCDQRYGVEDMVRIIESVKKV